LTHASSSHYARLVVPDADSLKAALRRTTVKWPVEHQKNGQSLHHFITSRSAWIVNLHCWQEWCTRYRELCEASRASYGRLMLSGEQRNSSRSRGARDRHRFESPQLHQVVRAKRRDFLRHRIARHFRSLPRQGSVSVGGPAILRANSRGVSPKVSGRKIPFPRLLFATCPPRPISNALGVRTSRLDPVRDGWISPSLEDK
jgi:hypothetical protein